jgi:hypothetical protein
MKKNLLLFLLAGLPWLADAQIKNRDWVLVGGERIRGSYTGISPAVADDRYQLQNLATWRFEFATSRRILFADLSWFPIKMIGILNDYHASTYTKERMMKVQNRTNFRFGCLYYLNKNKEANSRFVLGWQVDWRYMGGKRPGRSGGPVGLGPAMEMGLQSGWGFGRRESPGIEKPECVSGSPGCIQLWQYRIICAWDLSAGLALGQQPAGSKSAAFGKQQCAPGLAP